MPDRKKQHFVPKMYLRMFTNNKDGKTIGIYNLSSQKYIQVGSMRDQAYSNYFYGKDGAVEADLSKMEGEASQIIRHIIDDEKLPNNANNYLILLIFVMLLSARTEYSAEVMDDILDQTIKTMFRHDPG